MVILPFRNPQQYLKMIYTETKEGFLESAEGVWPDSWRLHIRLDGCCRLIDYVPPIDKLMWYFTRLYPPTLRLQDINLPS